MRYAPTSPTSAIKPTGHRRVSVPLPDRGGFLARLTGFDSVEGLIDDVSRIEIGDVRQARQECIDRLQEEMRRALEENSLGDTMNDVQLLKQRLC